MTRSRGAAAGAGAETGAWPRPRPAQASPRAADIIQRDRTIDWVSFPRTFPAPAGAVRPAFLVLCYRLCGEGRSKRIRHRVAENAEKRKRPQVVRMQCEPPDPCQWVERPGGA